MGRTTPTPAQRPHTGQVAEGQFLGKAARTHRGATIRTAPLLTALAMTLTVLAPVGASASHSAEQGPPSTYKDPCEHTPAGVTPSPVDLREVVLDGLFQFDDRTTTDAHQVDARIRLCRPLDSAASPPLRIDLHRRIDTPGGQDTDFSEDASRAVVLFPPPTSGDGWTWEIRDLEASGSVVATGPVTITGPESAVTQLRAALPPQAVRDAGDPDTSTATGLPPLAVRACSFDGDCGPGYEFAPPLGNRGTGGTTQPDVDYVPEPRHLPLTYPSICQGAYGPDAATRSATAAPGQVAVDAATGRRLTALGWSVLGTLDDGTTIVRGTEAAVRAVAPGATVDAVVLHRAAVEPNDPWYGTDGPGAPTGQWSLRRLDAGRAWDATTGDAGVRVAVLDSGFDGLHPDLAGRAAEGIDYVQTRGSTFGAPLDVTTDTDYGGHGSFVASIVAASTDDSVGMAGLGWDTTLLVARVFDAEACASDAALVDAIDWAVDRGAASVNLSLGGPLESTMLRRAGERAHDAGAIAVAASGNSGCPTDGSGRPLDLPEYPASYDSFLSVAATGYIAPSSTAQDPIAVYSTCNAGVDIAAPGGTSGVDPAQQVLGACWQDPFATRTHCREVGTSFATPLVAATIALLRAVDPDRTATGVRQLLTDTALDLTSCPRSSSPTNPRDFCRLGTDESSGAGRMRTGLAVELLATRADTLDVLAPNADPVGAAIAVSQAAFPGGGATTAVIARRDVFADTLAGAPLAGESGPILLTGSSSLDGRVSAELQRAVPRGSTVRLLGGTAALSEQVEQDVRALGYVPDRVAGATRIDTAIEIARRVAPNGSPQVLIASAANWPDAVAGGAYAADRRVPLLLTWPNEAPAVVQDELRRIGPVDVVVLGGPAAVDGPTATALDAAGSWRLRRVEGPHRWATATSVVTTLWGQGSGRSGDRFVLVNGQLTDGWAYGLAASPLAAQLGAPLLLTTDDHTLDQPRQLLRDTLRYRLDKPAFGVLIGPPSSVPALSASATQRLRELLGG